DGSWKIGLNTVNGKADFRTARHEAFHILFHTFLSEKERRRALDATLVLYSDEIKKTKGDISDESIEEYLADIFGNKNVSEWERRISQIDNYYLRKIVGIIYKLFQLSFRLLKGIVDINYLVSDLSNDISITNLMLDFDMGLADVTELNEETGDIVRYSI
ncbi:MAG: hypothetical protein NZ108_07245, partial [Bacteroidia bacterium]|nr:hypothetical protein [Bacteroidia bacterium]